MSLIFPCICLCPIYSQVTDESELMSYRSRREQWEVRQEEKKHVFTITQADLSSGGVGGGSNTTTPPKGGKVSLVPRPHPAFRVKQRKTGCGLGRG